MAQIVGLAHGLDVVPVAEGVDRVEQVDVLRAMGCDRAQGYLDGPPVPPDRVDELLSRRVRTPRSIGAAD